MRYSAAFAVPLTGLALVICPVAQADPTPDDYYSKWLSQSGVNYQGRVSFDEMISQAQMVCSALDKSPGRTTYVTAVNSIVAKGVFSQAEADKIAYSAIQSYCHSHIDSAFA